MNKRPIDRTKKSNIKCEHCKYWNHKVDNGNYINTKCSCENSKKYGTQTKYWNRCKEFGWAESEDKE